MHAHRQNGKRLNPSIEYRQSSRKREGLSCDTQSQRGRGVNELDRGRKGASESNSRFSVSYRLKVGKEITTYPVERKERESTL